MKNVQKKMNKASHIITKLESFERVQNFAPKQRQGKVFVYVAH
jgi:hypothetical protein